MAEALPFGRARRDFWRAYYFDRGPAAVTGGEDKVCETLDTLLSEHLGLEARPGHVHFIGAGPGDPELLTMKARRLLDEADVVIYDRLISKPILELARREALMIDAGKEGFGPSMSQTEINALIIEHAGKGAQVVRLKSGDATVFGRLDEEIDAVDAHNIAWDIVPGITSASAAVAAIGQSLTKRERNSSVRFLTGHDMKGFADHDWTTLSRPGEVTAIYMGKKSARFIQGRLIMHGADRHTPVTIVENASRPEQRILETTLDALPAALDAAQMTGPALTFYGLDARKPTATTLTAPMGAFINSEKRQEAF
jgi:uroporphyrin-III C-methyltransferase/precorrin-2 dehydrogenase/sirohydrochlorin ferrochelatase